MLALLALSACATGGQGGNGPAPARARTTVRVQNSAFSAFTIYAVSDIDRRRLGVVQPTSSATFVIPADMVSVGVTTMRFVADPIGSDRVATTYTLAVHEGDTLQLTLQ